MVGVPAKLELDSIPMLAHTPHQIPFGGIFPQRFYKLGTLKIAFIKFLTPVKPREDFTLKDRICYNLLICHLVYYHSNQCLIVRFNYQENIFGILSYIGFSIHDVEKLIFSNISAC